MTLDVINKIHDLLTGDRGQKVSETILAVSISSEWICALTLEYDKLSAQSERARRLKWSWQAETAIIRHMTE